MSERSLATHQQVKAEPDVFVLGRDVDESENQHEERGIENDQVVDLNDVVEVIDVVIDFPFLTRLQLGHPLCLLVVEE